MKNEIKRLHILFYTFLLFITSSGYLTAINKDDPFSSSKSVSNLPKPIGYVSDFENILSDSEEKELTNIIKTHEINTTDQIVIVTVSSIEPYENIDDYSLDIANYWGVGQKEKNNGVVIVLSKNLRLIRIQNGFGIEEKLPDFETKNIIDKVMIPEFKTDNYFLGLKNGLLAIIEELN